MFCFKFLPDAVLFHQTQLRLGRCEVQDVGKSLFGKFNCWIIQCSRSQIWIFYHENWRNYSCLRGYEGYMVLSKARGKKIRIPLKYLYYRSHAIWIDVDVDQQLCNESANVSLSHDQNQKKCASGHLEIYSPTPSPPVTGTSLNLPPCNETRIDKEETAVELGFFFILLSVSIHNQKPEKGGLSSSVSTSIWPPPLRPLHWCISCFTQLCNFLFQRKCSPFCCCCCFLFVMFLLCDFQMLTTYLFCPPPHTIWGDWHCAHFSSSRKVQSWLWFSDNFMPLWGIFKKDNFFFPRHHFFFFSFFLFLFCLFVSVLFVWPFFHSTFFSDVEKKENGFLTISVQTVCWCPRCSTTIHCSFCAACFFWEVQLCVLAERSSKTLCLVVWNLPLL